MRIGDIRAALATQERMAKAHNLPPCSTLPLVIIKDKPCRGYNIRTPFGLCEIANQQEIDGKYQVVFYAKRERVLSYIRGQA